MRGAKEVHSCEITHGDLGASTDELFEVDLNYWTARIEIIYNAGRHSKTGENDGEDHEEKSRGGFKAKVALAAIKGMKTSGQLATEFGVHPSVIARWKKQLLEGPEAVFALSGEVGREQEDKEAELYQQIGKLQMELEWLKKSCRLVMWPYCVRIKCGPATSVCRRKRRERWEFGLPPSAYRSRWQTTISGCGNATCQK